jgi:hypothetical protein
MPVNLSYQDKEGHQFLHPIAETQNIHQYWIPLATQLGLEIVPNFDWVTIRVTKDNAPLIIGELSSMQVTLMADPPPDFPTEMMLRRIEIAIAALHIIHDEDLTGSIS